ncbi:MAG: HTH-type transcriptional regulator DmlR [Desulfovibrio sp.]
MPPTYPDVPELLRDMPLFVEVAKNKSFSLAAEKLDMYTSTLSRRIALLEKRLGVQLFLRTTRRVELTDSGRIFYEKCRFVLDETENVYEEVARHMTRAAGPVRIAVPAEIYHIYLWGTSAKFAKKWPDIHLVVNFMTRWADLISEPYDVNIRVGRLPDSDLKARRLISLKPGVFASRKLLDRFGEPKTPQDLSAMPCIALPHQGAVWSMYKGKKKETVTITAAHTVNNASIAVELASEGLGVTWLAPAMLENHPDLIEHDLVHILPEWSVPGIDINLVMPNRQLPYRVRLYVDFLAEHFAQMAQ